MIRATFSTRQQQNIDEIFWEIVFIKAFYITNDSHGYLLEPENSITPSTPLFLSAVG
jgi:hypothetical protein